MNSETREAIRGCVDTCVFNESLAARCDCNCANEIMESFPDMYAEDGETFKEIPEPNRFDWNPPTKVMMFFAWLYMAMHCFALHRATAPVTTFDHVMDACLNVALAYSIWKWWKGRKRPTAEELDPKGNT